MKNYALIYVGKKVIKKKYETASGAKYDFPNASKIELFNSNGSLLCSINSQKNG